MNDFLYSNFVIYDAFFGSKKYDKSKILNITNTFKSINNNDLNDNCFSNILDCDNYDEQITTCFIYKNIIIKSVINLL